MMDRLTPMAVGTGAGAACVTLLALVIGFSAIDEFRARGKMQDAVRSVADGNVGRAGETAGDVARSVRPETDAALFLQAYSLASAGSDDAALLENAKGLYERLGRGGSSRVKALAEAGLGFTALLRGDAASLKTAETHFAAAVAEDSACAEGHVGLGAVAIRKKDYGEGVKNLTEALTPDKNPLSRNLLVETYTTLAALYEREGSLSKAADAARSAVAVGGDPYPRGGDVSPQGEADLRARMVWGRVILKQGRQADEWDKELFRDVEKLFHAVKQGSIAKRTDDRDRALFANALGIAAFTRGAEGYDKTYVEKKARSFLETAVQTAPAALEPIWNRAAMRLVLHPESIRNRREREELIAWYGGIVAHEGFAELPAPERGTVLQNLAALEFMDGKKEEGIARMGEAIALLEDPSVAQRNLDWMVENR